MHAFLHCLLSLYYRAKSGGIDVNQHFWLLNQISVTLFEEHPFIFIKLFRTKSHSGTIMALGVRLHIWLLSEQITLHTLLILMSIML